LSRFPSSTLVKLAVHDGAVRVVQHVGGHNRVFGVRQDALQLAFGRGLQRGVNFLRRGVLRQHATRSTTDTLGVGTRME